MRLFFSAVFVLPILFMACKPKNAGVDSAASATRYTAAGAAERCVVGETRDCPDVRHIAYGAVKTCNKYYNAVRKNFDWDVPRVTIDMVLVADDSPFAKNSAWATEHRITLDCQTARDKNWFVDSENGSYGLFVHELAHVFQIEKNLIPARPPWWIEGLADAIRNEVLQEGSGCKPGTTYTDGYSCAAALFRFAKYQAKNPYFIRDINIGLTKGFSLEAMVTTLSAGNNLETLFSQCAQFGFLCSVLRNGTPWAARP